jgi:hypothetical protein
MEGRLFGNKDEMTLPLSFKGVSRSTKGASYFIGSLFFPILLAILRG